jgi:hypothetical protein
MRPSKASIRFSKSTKPILLFRYHAPCFPCTVFPLKYTITGGEGESDTTEYISKGTAGFNRMFISNKEKMILNVTQGKSKAEVRFQIEGTGFEKDFIFELKDRKWHLAFIVDLSD